MEFQLVSDIHLELYKKTFDYDRIKPVAKYLILAGDIGQPYATIYQKFIQYCHENWQHIFIVAGNHEYYNCKKDMTKIETALTNLNSQYANVHYLQRTTFLLEDTITNTQVLVAGCTLWTNITNMRIQKAMTDYSSIHIKNAKGYLKKITISTINELHQDCVNWLDTQIMTATVRVLIITHHAPTFLHTYKDYTGEIDCTTAYATDLSKFMTADSPIKVWCHGHTHKHNYTCIHNTHIYCNPMGYPKEDTSYKENFTFTFV